MRVLFLPINVHASICPLEMGLKQVTKNLMYISYCDALISRTVESYSRNQTASFLRLT